MYIHSKEMARRVLETDGYVYYKVGPVWKVSVFCPRCYTELALNLSNDKTLNHCTPSDLHGYFLEFSAIYT